MTYNEKCPNTFSTIVVAEDAGAPIGLEAAFIDVLLPAGVQTHKDGALAAITLHGRHHHRGAIRRVVTGRKHNPLANKVFTRKKNTKYI